MSAFAMRNREHCHILSWNNHKILVISPFAMTSVIEDPEAVLAIIQFDVSLKQALNDCL
jgi:hypothetical protein